MYQDYAKYFDKIFPANDQSMIFLMKHLKGKNILDIGCGSGEMSIALSKDYTVTGMDLDEEMIAYAKTKSNDVTFMVGNMLEMDETIYDSIYCIGNTVVHLPNQDDIQQFLMDVYQKLNDGGRFIMQIINYDRVLDEYIEALPTIVNEGVTFVRNYERVEDKIRFSTRLSAEGKEYRGYVDLIPLRKNKLEEMLMKANFKKIEMYSGFSDKVYSKEAYALVVSASK